MPKKSEFIKLMERGEVDDSYNKRGDKVASSRSRKASDKNNKNKKTGQQAQDDFTKLLEKMLNKAVIIKLDIFISKYMSTYGILLLRYSLAMVFIWFGLLKPLGISPAQELVENTVYWFDDKAVFVKFLGWWEVVIGFTMCVRPLIRISIFLLFLQMPGTFLPLVLLPEVCFTDFPYGLTLEGQYIVKNMIIISSALVIGGTVRKNISDSTKKHIYI